MQTLGRKLAELFPAELAEQFDRVRGETGIHHLYESVLKRNPRPKRSAILARYVGRATDRRTA